MTPPSEQSDYPRLVPIPGPTDVVQILGPRLLIDALAQRMPNGWTLSSPVVFSEDDLPTYVATGPGESR